jgi:hypothetical protein
MGMDVVMAYRQWSGFELVSEVYYCLAAVVLCDPRRAVVEWWCRKTK